MEGIYYHTMDAKGRLFVPSQLRNELGPTFFVTLSMENCLSAYSAESWKSFSDRIKAMPRVQQIRMRPLYSHAARVEPDGQGRILLPQELRDRVGLKKDIAVVGNGDNMQIWDADEWRRVDEVETSAENIAAVFAELDF